MTKAGVTKAGVLEVMTKEPGSGSTGGGIVPDGQSRMTRSPARTR